MGQGDQSGRASGRATRAYRIMIMHVLAWQVSLSLSPFSAALQSNSKTVCPSSAVTQNLKLELFFLSKQTGLAGS